MYHECLFCLPHFIFADKPLIKTLRHQATNRIAAALRPRTSASYTMAFKQFLAFIVYMNLTKPFTEGVILSYLEYLSQNGLKNCSLRNHLSILKHFFAMFNWSTVPLTTRKIHLFLKSVQVNTSMKVKVKGVFTVKMLEQLVKKSRSFQNGQIFAAVFLTAFFGFFRLSTLVPSTLHSFDKTRFPIQNDLIWAKPGAHIIITCSKSMQDSGKIQVVQLPSLTTLEICPIKALRWLINHIPQGKQKPLFQILTKNGWQVLTAPKVRSFLKLVVTALGWNPSTFTFHAFRRSGASLAFDNHIDLAKIKQHGNWRSEAIWTYLNSTPTSAGTVPTTFQRLLLTT